MTPACDALPHARRRRGRGAAGTPKRVGRSFWHTRRRRGRGSTALIELPLADPGQPDTRSPVRLLVWVGRHQVGTITIAIVFGIVWMVAQALMPYAIGQAIQQGIVDDDNDALVRFCALLAVLGVVQAAAGVMRHRYAVQNWLQASFRLAQVVGHHAARSGDAVRARALDRRGRRDGLERRLAGRRRVRHPRAPRRAASSRTSSWPSILLTTSVVLGLLVLIGVPLLTVSLSFVIKPLQLRQREQREEVGLLTALGADTAAGLRVLRGVGGEQAFFDRYQLRSEAVRGAGVRVATPQSTLDAAQVLLPGPLRRPRHLGRRASRRVGGDHGRRARRVLRVRGLPRDSAADVGGGGREVHARARRRPQDVARPRRRACRRRSRRPAARAARRRSARRPGFRPHRSSPAA